MTKTYHRSLGKPIYWLNINFLPAHKQDLGSGLRTLPQSRDLQGPSKEG